MTDDEPPNWGSKPTPTGQEVIYTVKTQAIQAQPQSKRTWNPFKRMWNKRMENIQRYKDAHGGMTPQEVEKRNRMKA